MEWYKRWVLKQASTAQCSPALMAAAMACGFIIIGYVYFQTILITVLITLVVVVCLAIAAMLGLLLRQMIRWNKKVYPVHTGEEEAAPMASRLSNPIITGPSDPAPVQDTEATAMAADIDTLADDDLELVWAPDGKTLLGRKSGN